MKKFIWLSIAALTIAGIGLGFYMTATNRQNYRASNAVDPKHIDDLNRSIQNRASYQYEKRRLQLSIAVHEKMLKAAPGNSDIKKKLARAHYELGILEEKLGDEDAARKNISKARELDPTISETH